MYNNQNIKKTKLEGEAMDLKHLVSGTDIRGIVSEVEGKKVKENYRLSLNEKSNSDRKRS